MLMKLGIRSHIYLDTPKDIRKSTMDAFVLMILDKESLIGYKNSIGFSITSKQEILDRIIKSYKGNARRVQPIKLEGGVWRAKNPL